MISPEPGAGERTQTSLLVLLRNNLLAVALIFAGLECWRPYFFLTDDNLNGVYPFFMEMGQHLLSGRSPFISDHLFGGGYNFLRDPGYFGWHPVYFLESLLAGTPFHLALVEVIAFVFLLLAAAGFVNLAHYLRREMALTISDGWIMFYTLSFTYSMIVLTTGASWVSFLGNQSAMPWLAFAILQRTWRRGIALVTLFSLHSIMAGHLAPTVSTSIFFSLFALVVSISRRSFLPLGSWFAGYALALVVLLPLMVPMLGGFFSSTRGTHGVPLADMQSNNVPFMEFPTALFFGMNLWIVNSHEHPGATYTEALGACAAAWCLVPAFFSRTPWRPVELASLGTALFAVLLICRPVWITEIMTHLPLFRSMRWPFREFLQFQFFLHLFLLARAPGLTKPLRIFFAAWGTALMVVPMLLYVVPPTFNPMYWDRELVLSGGFDRYWGQVRPLLKPGDRVAVIIPRNFYEDEKLDKPYSLLATFNYAVLAHVVNTGGYSQTAPRDQLYTKTQPYYPFGAFLPEQKAALLAERPDLKFITLESVQPLKITLSSGDGPTIDLTPLVPKRIGSP